MEFNIEKILIKLSKKRKLFHSEADFQHALAWEIQDSFPQAKIRLEIKFGENSKEYLDILVKIGNRFYPIELKYKTKLLNTDYNEEEFNLSQQGAYDHGRYDFIKDVSRLERYIKGKSGTGYAIMLTNDENYWHRKKRRDTNDESFKIYERRSLKGKLKWKESTGAGTLRGREKTIFIKGSYSVKWDNYSNINSQEFKYLLLEVK